MATLDATFLRSRVARRIFLLFVLCALLPIAVLAIVSFREVTRHLDEQSRARLRQGSKAVGMSIFERLSFLDAEMRLFSANLRISGLKAGHPLELLSNDLQERFISLALLDEPSRPVPLFGRFENPPALSAAEKKHLSAGKAIISIQQRELGSARVMMSRAVDPREPERAIVTGEINPSYLWGFGEQDTLPPLTELCVLDESRAALVCSFGEGIRFHGQAALNLSWSSTGEFEWRHGDQQYLAGYWSIPLKFNFLVPQWTVVLFESKADVLAPIARFTRIFPLVIVVFMGLVLLLSLGQIRRTLVPLEKLQEGTKRIAMRDFSSRVTVHSGDEFQQLAESFNAMADRLFRQFNTLAAMADIDRAILSVLDAEKIVSAVLTRIPDVLSCDAIAVAVMVSDDRAEVHVSEPARGNRAVVEPADLGPEALRTVYDHPEHLWLGAGGFVPEYVAPLARRGCRSFLSLPIFFQEKLFAIISLGYARPPAADEEMLLHARQIADQVAIGISNARLYRQISEQAVSLERANRVKDEFLSVMSHELRTPLTVVKGYAGMLLEGLFGEMNEEQEKALRLMLKRTNDLLALITTILEATRIESETIETVREEVDLRGLIEKVKVNYSFERKKELTMDWEVPADLPVIRTDPEKLTHILDNLINNAVKFTDRGSVTVSARRDAEHVEFSVQDTGVGIPADALPVIFEKFRQLDSSDNRLYEGAGLGLYIVKKFTELLGGEIKVESEPGKGSLFAVRIPCSTSLS